MNNNIWPLNVGGLPAVVEVISLLLLCLTWLSFNESPPPTSISFTGGQNNVIKLMRKKEVRIPYQVPQKEQTALPFSRYILVHNFELQHPDQAHHSIFEMPCYWAPH